jgi:hypothetical protein
MKVVLATLFTTLRMERPRGAVSRPVRCGISIGASDGVKLRARKRQLGAGALVGQASA